VSNKVEDNVISMLDRARPSCSTGGERGEKKFERGDKVRVVKPIGAVEKAVLGLYGTFLCYTVPHGYAKVVIDGVVPSFVMIHPEALERV
jgi:hypothetical protein